MMAELLASEAQEILNEDQPDDNRMSNERFTSIIRDLVYDAENWLENDISPERTRAHRYYQGECDLPSAPNRSSFVVRVVRNCVEQAMPQLMKTLAGGTHIVQFQAKEVDEQAQSMAQDATEAVHHVFWNLNKGWENIEGFLRDALKAKTGTFKVYDKEEVKVVEREFQGPLVDFVQVMDGFGDDVDVQEYREDTIETITQGVLGPVVLNQTIVSATLHIKQRSRRIAIECIAPEELLVNRAATGTDHGEYTLLGHKSIKTVSEVVEMGVPFEVAKKHAGSGVEGATGDYQDEERRARRSLSSDPYEEQTFTDDSTRPIAYYELYVRVDRDGDGIAELLKVCGVGEGPAKIVTIDGEERMEGASPAGLLLEMQQGENVVDMVDLVDDHPLCTSPAIAVEHSVIGESLADNVMDLQDVRTQIRRQILDNLVLHNNPRRKAVKSQYNQKQLVENKFNGFIEVDNPAAITYDVTPFVGDKGLVVEQAMADEQTERTGISKESMGLDAQNLQASSEIGVLAVLGAGKTQPDMIAATIAHRAFVPLARKIVRLLKEKGEPISILSDGAYREVNPTEWPDDMDVKVTVGLGTGSKDHKLQALDMIKREQKEILGTLGPQNPLVKPEQYAYTLARMTQLAGVGQSTDYFNSPEEVRRLTAQPPPEGPDPEVEKAQLDSQTTLQKAQIDAEADIAVATIKAEQDERESQRETNAELVATMAKIESGTPTNTNIRKT